MTARQSIGVSVGLTLFVVGAARAEPIDPAVAQRLAADPRLVRLKAAVFDPLRGAEPVPDALLPRGPLLREAAAADPYLVQFDGPITATVRERLVERGVDVLGYVPNRTLAVRPRRGVSSSVLDAVAGRRWTGAFAARYKLDPDLLRSMQLVGSPSEMITIDVHLFRDEEAGPLVDAVARRFDGAAAVHVEERRPSRITFHVPAPSLAPLVGSLIGDAAVQFVERRLGFEPYNDHAVWIGQSYDRTNGPVEAEQADPKPYDQSATIWNRGLTGEGQIVAVADTGLEHGMCFFHDPAHPVTPQTVFPPAPLEIDADHRKIVAYNAPLAFSLTTDDSFRHGTHTSGSVCGDDRLHAAAGGDPGHDHGDGMAPGARLVFEDISGAVDSACSTSIIVNSVADLLEQEYLAGARISTNSWGPGSASAALGADTASWTHEDLLVFVAAGNGGAGGIAGLPACKNCITVGATENYDDSFVDEFGFLDPENMTALSSRGPASDGRIKPDIVAPGFRVASARFPVAYIVDEDDPACDPGDPRVCLPGFGGCYVTETSESCHADLLLGTSMSSPVAAGLAALARQYFTDGFHPTGQAEPSDARVPSAALLKALLINGARNMTGRLYERRGTPVDFGPLEDAPSNVQGWGRILLDDALYFAGETRRTRLFDIPNVQGLAGGESVRLRFDVSATSEPLKATLVWTGPPALPAASGTLVNDLDLLLTAPDGTAYRGNQWTADDIDVPGDKQSQADPPGKDGVNNVEEILIHTPAAGPYTVTVLGSEVPGNDDLLTQGAALVVTGSVGACTAVDAPANPAVAGASGAEVELAWDPVAGALGYNLYRSGSTCSDPMASDRTIAVPGGVTSFVDTDVEPETLYNYTVRAVVSADGCETPDSECVSVTTPALGPPPVPDGSFGTPMLAERMNVEGTLIRVSWDAASCAAPGNHLLYGSLAGVGQLTPQGARCGLGVSGVHDWSEVPPGDVWFVVVSEDGAFTEGSWGRRSDGTQRGGATPSGRCGTFFRDNTGICF